MELDNSPVTNHPSPNKKKPADACILIIFGVAGDLTKRLLFPAICNLARDGLLDKNFCMVGVARSPDTEEDFRTTFEKSVTEFITDPEAKKIIPELMQRVFYVSGTFEDPQIYTDLKNKLAHLEKLNKAGNYIFYCAAPPSEILPIACGLSKADLLNEKEGKYFRRIAIEKPFGHDVKSAKKLNKDLLSLLHEKQIFRVDHFLGKETVQNIQAFRFENAMFEPIWNHAYIDNVQMTVAETLGVESRGSYYEQAGALRDMVPNHLVQLLSLITMEPPAVWNAADIRHEKLKALKAVQTLTPAQVKTQVVRGQYGAGDNVSAYRSEAKVASDSAIETYVALKLFLNNARWKGVPFYLRTGKRMAAHTSEIFVQFKNIVATLPPDAQKNLQPNCLQLSLQPNEGIVIRFNSKIPGQHIGMRQFEMKFNYNDYYNMKSINGYEAILYDCMIGNHILFKTAELVETGWKIVQPILDEWQKTPPNFPNYAAGSWGPKAADELLTNDGRQWLR